MLDFVKKMVDENGTRTAKEISRKFIRDLKCNLEIITCPLFFYGGRKSATVTTY